MNMTTNTATLSLMNPSLMNPSVIPSTQYVQNNPFDEILDIDYISTPESNTTITYTTPVFIQLKQPDTHIQKPKRHATPMRQYNHGDEKEDDEKEEDDEDELSAD